MKIAQCIWGLSGGGAQQLVIDLSVELKMLGHEVDVILINRPTGDSGESEANKLLCQKNIPTIFLNRKPGHPGIKATIRLSRLINSNRYDIVHAHLAGVIRMVGIASWLSTHKSENILTIHSTQEHWSSTVKWAAKFSTKVACSEAVAQKFRDRNTEVFVIPNGINIAKLSKPSDFEFSRETLGLPLTSTVIVGVGRLRTYKNYPCLIKAIHYLKGKDSDRPAHLIICGDGEDNAQLVSLSEKLDVQDRIHLLGACTNIEDYLHFADLYVSTALYEGLPLSVLEALASGIPCVLSPIKEHLDVAAKIEACFFTLKNEPYETAKTINHALKIMHSREEILRLRQPTLEYYSINRCASEYEAIYQKMIKLGV